MTSSPLPCPETLTIKYKRTDDDADDEEKYESLLNEHARQYGVPPPTYKMKTECNRGWSWKCSVSYRPGHDVYLLMDGKGDCPIKARYQAAKALWETFFPN